MPESSDSAFDTAALARLHRFGGEKLVREMITVYLEHAVTRRDAIRAALAADDREALRGASHALKSSSAQLGASRLSSLLGAMEADALTGDLEALRALGQEVDGEYDRSADWLLTQRPNEPA